MLIPALLLASSCSINKLAVHMVAKTLSSGSGIVYTGDEDPQLIADSLPFAMKLYESLLEQDPKNPALLLTTARIFTLYANAFIQTPAGMLPDTDYEKQDEMLKRAKKMYVRGRKYAFRALEVRHPGFNEQISKNEMEKALNSTTVEDVPFLFIASAAWLGAFSTDPFDMELLLSVSKALAIMNRALELDEGYDNGAIHDFFITVYGSLPPSLGGSEEKARYHFAKAVASSKGLKASPYVALASCVSVGKQDTKEFQELLHKALAIDPDANPENRLFNLLNQQKARWLLDHMEDFFLLEGGEEW